MDEFQRCFIIHRRLHGESSLILNIFSELYGCMTLISKGVRVRKRSNLKGILQPFTPLLLCWSGNFGSLKTLIQAEPISIGLPLSGINLYSAMYINELIGRLLMQEVAMPGLFYNYLSVLTKLAQEDNPEPALRCFELELLSAIGYGVNFLYCEETGFPINPNMLYRYSSQKGFIISIIKDDATFLGNELLLMNKRQFITKEQLRVAKRFTRIALKPHIGNKPLKSRELFFRKNLSHRSVKE
ncbi:DNA repair protein [Candidatus Photodesmus katoptron]|uniref:DNA repair protein RecO n=1 Tax=Candidatus Photodesmus katoptron Akat1 TaxID=1236703 RepID=S3DZI0_9GAMM|nr:DNA repair protein RecO [Candidatus Photodesmus katoptron]EPE37321.1 DNA repair protein RecO [Candidatus Photodesmus katoptron Akat1]KEY90008.1 DNA repair protein [Candidatus Photodesmus katoptron]